MAPTNSTEQETITNEEIGIAKNLIQGVFDEVWGGVDTAKVSLYHTSDFYILEHGEVWDNDRIQQYMLQQKARDNRQKRVNRMDYITIEKHGGVLNVAYHNFAEFYTNDSLVGQAQWLESALAVPTEDGWRLRTMHSTRVNR